MRRTSNVIGSASPVRWTVGRGWRKDLGLGRDSVHDRRRGVVVVLVFEIPQADVARVIEVVLEDVAVAGGRGRLRNGLRGGLLRQALFDELIRIRG